MSLDDFLREQIQPADQHRREDLLIQQRVEVGFYQVGGADVIARRQQVTQRVLDQACLGQPLTGAMVQFGQAGLALLLLELVQQKIAEQIVIAVPGALVIERNDKQILRFQPGDGSLTGSRPGTAGQQGLAQGGAEAVYQGGAGQERSHRLRQVGHDLLYQVARQQPVAAVKARQELVGRLILQGEGGQLQPDDPALGSRLQRFERHLIQGPAGLVLEQAARFGQGKAQVGGPNLGDLPAHPQPSQQQWRIGAGQDDQVQPGWPVV